MKDKARSMLLTVFLLLTIVQAVIRVHLLVESFKSAITHNVGVLSNNIQIEGQFDHRIMKRPSVSIDLRKYGGQNYWRIRGVNGAIVYASLEGLSKPAIWSNHKKASFDLFPYGNAHSLRIAAAFPKLSLTFREYHEIAKQIRDFYDGNGYFEIMRRITMKDWSEKMDFIFFTICLKRSSPSENPLAQTRPYNQADLLRFFEESRIVNDIREEILQRENNEQLINLDESEEYYEQDSPSFVPTTPNLFDYDEEELVAGEEDRCNEI